MIKKVTDKIEKFLGGWAFYLGSVMADGFETRMQEIAEEEEAKMNAEEEEASKLPNLKVN